ncbi:hypothetical protein U9M48_039294 [Paspalum notatum var. saurae]|uniref:Uncharacterized protein n=1 Tax=Paspalum notatum var. saurae TaxID=547442 RepID=A0AAQ3UJU6_PASNO
MVRTSSSGRTAAAVVVVSFREGVVEEQEPVAASTTLPSCRSSQVARPHHRRIGSIAKPIRAILRETSAAAA